MSTNKNLEIKFGGDLHEIDLDILIESLVSYSCVAQETSAYLSQGEKVDIKIKATKQGSFAVELILKVAKNTASLFSAENISLASEIVAIIGGLYGLKKWIAKYGKPEIIRPTDDENINISNKNGNITINKNVYNIYNEKPQVRENLRKTFAKLKEKEEIDDFSLKDIDTGQEIFNVSRCDFSALASDDDEVEQRKQKVIKEKQELFVFKVVFKDNYKWEFFYQGIKIYALIDDKMFFSKIEKGEIAFRSGDKLIVDLQIEQIFNESANTFVNESYNVLSVIEHIPRVYPTQPSFDFEK
jgi:hypothetical protein